MIYGIGTDVIMITRLAVLWDKYGDKLAIKLLSEAEQKELGLVKDKPRFLAKRFAAKEAFAKALGTGIRGFWFTDIEISHTHLGQPVITPLGRCAALCKQQRIGAMHLSVSDEKALAQAFVVLEVLN